MQFYVSPLTLGDTSELDVWLQYEYLRHLTKPIEQQLPEIREAFLQSIRDAAQKLVYQSEAGYHFYSSKPERIIRVVWQFIYKKTTIPYTDFMTLCAELKIPELLKILIAVNQCVSRSLPESKTQRNERTSQPSDEEDNLAITRTFKLFAKEYHFSFEQVQNMTPYQIYYYMALLPEEEQHLAELESMLRRNEQSPSRIHSNPNVMHFSTSEEYDAWLSSKK
jgi:hypothetical protein